MFHYHRLRAILNPQIPKCYLLHQTHFLKPFSTTSESDQQSFTVSYLTNTCGLSPQKALKASKRFHFKTPKKPDSIISFFKTHGFSNDQIQSIIHKTPSLLTFDPIKTILPKFQFLSSKGASTSDIVYTVTRFPHFLGSSLQKQIIPTFELVRSFCPSDQKAITIIIASPSSIRYSRMKPNVNFLLHLGVTPTSIYRLLTTRISTICSTDLKIAVEEIKGLGFNPCKFSFVVALLVKKVITKSQWDAKVDALKSWGCSQDEIFNAFKRQPNFMLRSTDKLNAVMRIWTKQFGWDPLVLLAAPDIFGFSIEKRLIPRASVVQYLLSKGLMKKYASLVTPFYLTDELFLQKYVNRFEEEAYMLLKLYQGEDSSIQCMDKLSKHVLV
ncbi:transcription termination factor MTERF15, mitochondrial [Trifolium repens]|nr:transcription termination factor MTERF15, mitochondrial [Trifolium repens]